MPVFKKVPNLVGRIGSGVRVSASFKIFSGVNSAGISPGGGVSHRDVSVLLRNIFVITRQAGTILRSVMMWVCASVCPLVQKYTDLLQLSVLLLPARSY